MSHIKEESGDKSFLKGFVVGKIVPGISICILVYLIYSSGTRYVIFTIFWMFLAWLFMRPRVRQWRDEGKEYSTACECMTSEK